MLAVIKTGGKQYIVQPGETILVEKLKIDPGKEIIFQEVLLFEKDGKVEVGTPYLENVKVKGKVLGEKKGKKVVILKYKPRRRYRVKKGHRQKYTEVKIEEILVEDKS